MFLSFFWPCCFWAPSMLFSAQAAWLPQSPQEVQSGAGWDTHLNPRDALLLINFRVFGCPLCQRGLGCTRSLRIDRLMAQCRNHVFQTKTQQLGGHLAYPPAGLYSGASGWYLQDMARLTNSNGTFLYVFGIMGQTDKASSSGVASFEQADHPSSPVHLDLVESWQHLATLKRQSKDIQGTSETQHWSTVLVASEKRSSMCLLNAQNIIKHQCQRAEKCLIKIRFFLEREPGSETRPSKSKNARKSRKQAKTKENAKLHH